MAQRETFLRYLFIIGKLRNSRRATFNDIHSYLRQESDILGDRLTISKRTFQRYLWEIRSLFNIDIQCDKDYYYYIAGDVEESFNHRVMEAFDVFNSLTQARKISQYIIPEKRRPQGTEHLQSLLKAISKRYPLEFSYQKHWEDAPSRRKVKPLGLKEFKGRWYLLAEDQQDSIIKSFGLDRIKELEVGTKEFRQTVQFDPDALFSHSFGITNPTGQEPEEVILSCDHVQGNYIKSYPLHSSQEVVGENEEEIQIKVKLRITHDFKMELLSYGEKLKVLSPQSLRIDIRETYLQALKNYE